ncbi:MAG TPA: NtaA/DmoA family FMN-dependent monooxygenase [Steroidobacteraceae bacterium]|nr:NtaA/DmoA family FMN-dependent monooxygenase [Steroidobacteraceae bacterium]
MTQRPFHLGWFLNFTPDDWDLPFGNGGMPFDGEFYVEVARTLERACFDYMMIEDKLLVPEAYGGSIESALRLGMMAPKHDPAPLAAICAAATRHLGTVVTLSTLAYPPFLLARLCSTLDSLSGGRFGWNIVTSAENLAAQNFGLEKLPPREQRYDMADEYVDIVNRLFDSWAPDAVIRDREHGIYADWTKVKPINHKGQYFSVRGPLNTVRSPQGRPVYVQAGGSPRGRRFAARHADSIVAVSNGLQQMKAFRDDIRRLAVAEGRNPEQIKVLFLVTPVLGETDAEARQKQQRMVQRPNFIEQILAIISAITDIDFAKFHLDEVLPHLTTNGEQGSLDKFQQPGSGKTLRQLVLEASGGFAASIELIGTPDHVADLMREAMEFVGGDGFLITTPTQRMNRSDLISITDGLVPVLQRRGLVRAEYRHKRLRDTLREF